MPASSAIRRLSFVHFAFATPGIVLVAAVKLAGGLMLTIGWVMGDAARIAKENRGIV